MAPDSMAWLPLCATVFALGIRHGLDADHVAAIDGLTRFNREARPQLAHWCGALFAAGHGGVLVLFAVAVGTSAAHAVVPAWAEDLGAWISIGFLLALGLLNLALVVRTPAETVVHPSGLRSRLLSRLMRTSRPVSIAAIGALFAISFDTLSQAILFGALTAPYKGWHCGLTLGVLFTLGMLLVDGLNGAWIAVLLERADRRARIASRMIGLFVAILSILVALTGVLRYFDPAVNSLLPTGEPLAGVFLVVTVALVIAVLGLAYSRRDSEISSAHTDR